MKGQIVNKHSSNSYCLSCNNTCFPISVLV